MDENDYIGPSETARITHLSIDHLAQLRFRGRGPRFYKPSARKVLYRRSEVLAWLESTAVAQTA